MNKNRTMLHDAIADARAVKETALANAKAAIAEAFTPQLKSLFSKKIQEMEEGELDEYGDEQPISNADALDDDDTNDEPMDESFLFEEDEEDSKEEDIDIDLEDEESEEADDEAINIEDMTEAELTSFIEDIVKDMASTGELEGSVDEPTEDEMGDEFEDADMGDDSGSEDAGGDSEEVDLQELFSSYKRSKIVESKRPIIFNRPSTKRSFTPKVNLQEVKMKKEISKLRSEINEVNLLNTKLLYTNKIFKSKNLSESQKRTVVASFDRATTSKEARLVYESINATISTPVTKTPIKESYKPSASSIMRGTLTENKKANIIESDPMVLRFQKLAGIIK